MYTQCAKCETVFRLAAETLRAAGGQVRCGRCGEVFNALARLAEDPSAFPSAESAMDMEARADEILGKAVPRAPQPRKTPPEPRGEVLQVVEKFADDAVRAASSPPAAVTTARIPMRAATAPPPKPPKAVEESVDDGSMEFTLPPGELDRVFVERARKAPPASAATQVAPQTASLPAIGAGPEISEEVRREMLSGLSGLPDPEVAALLDHPDLSPAPPPLWQFNLWLAAAAALALLLCAQWVHGNREWLAAHAPGPLHGLYAAFGIAPSSPPNLSSYQLRQWGVTGEPSASGTLRVRASILNAAAQLQPYPLLRVTLANRFGTKLGSRDFEPAEYSGRPIARMLAPGERADATLDIVDPGQDAEGFEIDVCLRRRSKNLMRGRCCDAIESGRLVKIGPYVLSSNVVLAPMAGVTDLPFRMLCRRFGAGLAASEMLTSDARLWDTPKSRRRMDHRGEPGPRAVQIAGFDPEMMADAARRNVDAGAQIIDINMGCTGEEGVQPSLRFGADEGRGPGRAHSSSGGRRGERPGDAEDANRLGSAPQERHRRRAHRRRLRNPSSRHPWSYTYGHVSGRGEHETVRAVKNSVGIPVLANGDIDSPLRAKEILSYTGCDGVMIGRAAQGRPWIFDEVNFFLGTGEIREELAQENVRDIMRAHLEDLYDFYGEETGVRVARKHLNWYFRQHPGQEALRQRLVRIETPHEQLATLLEQYRHASAARRVSAHNRRKKMIGRDIGWNHGCKKESQGTQRPRSAVQRTRSEGQREGRAFALAGRRGAAELLRDTERP